MLESSLVQELHFNTRYISDKLKDYAQACNMIKSDDYIERLCQNSIELSPGHIIAMTIANLTESYLPITAIDKDFKFFYTGNYGQSFEKIMASPFSLDGTRLSEAEGIVQMCHVRVPSLDFLYDRPSHYTLATFEYVFNTNPDYACPLELVKQEYKKLGQELNDQTYKKRYEALKNKVGTLLITESKNDWTNAFKYNQLMDILSNDPEYASYYRHIKSVEKEFLINGREWVKHLQEIKKRRDAREQQE